MVWRPFAVKEGVEKRSVANIDNWYVTLCDALVL